MTEGGKVFLRFSPVLFLYVKGTAEVEQELLGKKALRMDCCFLSPLIAHNMTA